MNPSKTEKNICRTLLDSDGLEASIDQLKNILKVSRATIYNGVSALREKRFEIVSPSRGKVALQFCEQWRSDQLRQRFGKSQDLKRIAAAEIIRRGEIKPGMTLYLDCGSTVRYVGTEIINKRISNLTIHLLNPVLIKDFCEFPVSDLYFLGGKLSPEKASFEGRQTEERLRSMPYVDAVVLGVDSIWPDGTIATFTCDEIRKKRTILEKGSKILIPVDEEKIGKRRGSPMGQLKKASDGSSKLLFDSDSGFPEQTRDALVIIGKSKKSNNKIQKAINELRGKVGIAGIVEVQ